MRPFDESWQTAIAPVRSRMGQHHADAVPSVETRALVSVTPAERDEQPSAPSRPCAEFLTQLIATAQHVPQTCARRRAEPADAVAIYEAAVGRVEPALAAIRSV